MEFGKPKKAPRLPAQGFLLNPKKPNVFSLNPHQHPLHLVHLPPHHFELLLQERLEARHVALQVIDAEGDGLFLCLAEVVGDEEVALAIGGDFEARFDRSENAEGSKLHPSHLPEPCSHDLQTIAALR